MLLFVFPDAESMEYLLTQVTVVHMEPFQNIFLYTLSYHGRIFLAVLSGYGKANVARALTLAQQSYPVTAVLGVCTAGSLDTWQPDLFSIFIPDSALQYDVDVTELGYPGATLPGLPTGLFDADPAMIELVRAAAAAESARSHTGRIASADRFAADEGLRSWLVLNFDAAAVDMECGVLGELAYLTNVPFCAIKAICNNAACDAAAQYNSYHAEALLLAQRVALRYVLSL